MKKLILSFLTLALCATFSFGQNSPLALTDGVGTVNLIANPTPNGTDLQVQTVGGNGRSRVQIIPNTGSAPFTFIEVLNASDQNNAGFMRVGARADYGILAATSVGAPAQEIKHIGIELDPRGILSGESFVISTGGFLGTTNGTVETMLFKTDISGISTIEAKVQATVAAPDYVFKEDYNLRSLDEVEAYINEHSHLPEIPSAAEFAEDGITLGKMSFDLLKKVEELTLYMIDMKKENEELKARITELEESK